MSQLALFWSLVESEFSGKRTYRENGPPGLHSPGELPTCENAWKLNHSFPGMMDPQSDKGCDGWARAGGRGWAGPSPSPTYWLFHLSDTCEANLVWSMGRWGLLVRPTKEGWACQMESGSGRLEEPSLSSAPVITCRIKEETFLPPPCPPASVHQAHSQGSFQKILTGVPSIHRPPSWHRHPDKGASGGLLKPGNRRNRWPTLQKCHGGSEAGERHMVRGPPPRHCPAHLLPRAGTWRFSFFLFFPNI